MTILKKDLLSLRKEIKAVEKKMERLLKKGQCAKGRHTKNRKGETYQGCNGDEGCC